MMVYSSNVTRIINDQHGHLRSMSVPMTVHQRALVYFKQAGVTRRYCCCDMLLCKAEWVRRPDLGGDGGTMGNGGLLHISLMLLFYCMMNKENEITLIDML